MQAACAASDAVWDAVVVSLCVIIISHPISSSSSVSSMFAACTSRKAESYFFACSTTSSAKCLKGERGGRGIESASLKGMHLRKDEFYGRGKTKRVRSGGVCTFACLCYGEANGIFRKQTMFTKIPEIMQCVCRSPRIAGTVSSSRRTTGVKKKPCARS